MISLLVCGPYVYENDTLQECLLHAKMSLPFLIALISVCTQAHLREGGGWRGVTTDWLALFIIMRRFILDVYTQVKCTFLHVPPPRPSPRCFFAAAQKCYSYFCASRDWNVDCVKAHLLTFFRKLFTQPERFSAFPACRWLASLLYLFPSHL